MVQDWATLFHVPTSQRHRCVMKSFPETFRNFSESFVTRFSFIQLNLPRNRFDRVRSLLNNSFEIIISLCFFFLRHFIVFSNHTNMINIVDMHYSQQWVSPNNEQAAKFNTLITDKNSRRRRKYNRITHRCYFCKGENFSPCPGCARPHPSLPWLEFPV